MAVNYTSETGNALLRISDVEGDDEAIYKCEITYLEVIENCDVVQIVHLKTLKVPDSVKIHLGDGRPIKNLTVLQARMEGDEMNLICEAAGGKPIPQVKWFKGSEEIERADYTTLSSGGGFGTGRSKLDLTLSRSELMANFECKVESDALKQPIVSRVTTDVYVRPINITLNGTEKYVVQGSNVKLECVVTGARPKATIRWMNGTKEIKESDLRTSITGESPLRTKFMDEKYGTIMTVGILEFKATHYENGKTIFCLTHNEVMTNFSEPDMQASKILDVRYPPVVTVSPLQVTVNESTDDKATNVFFQCNGFANPQTLEAAKWMKDGKDLIVTDNKKYIGGDLVNPPLYINNVNRDDMGAYNCSLKNEIGESTSKDTIILNVQYTPSVEIIMDPPTPLKAVDKSDVMLMCNVTAGNPSNLLKVRWYLDGRLMKELPECDYNKEDGGEFCGLEPIFLNLTRVIQTYAGNYTCQGQNDAGWGLVSNPQELVVYYPPTTVNLTYFPSSVSEVVKGANITLNCTVMNPGRPENLTYYWYRASHRMEEYNTSYVVLKSLRVEERSKFTCIAVNDGGESEPASVDIKVNAPPAFITPLQKYQGILYNSNNISLTCRVECFPQCSIIWYKNGMRLNLDQDSLYYVEMKELKADVQKNDFESIESTLIWNLTAWPGNVLDKFSPHSNYTCEATSNGIGKAVHSTIEIAVDFPPEDVKVIPQIVKVKEGEIPGSVTCQGKGHPKLSYEWRKNITAPVNNTTGELSLGKLKRDQSGSYICIAYNKHPPNKTAEVYFDVLFAPECTVTPSERDGNPALVCTANANPQEVTFVWEAIEGNETFSMDSNIQSDGMRSYLILDTSIDVARTYYCKVNNSVGKGEMCETPVDGNVPWWNRFDNERLIIVIAASIAIIIVVIILCILIIMLCRRKRAQTKYNNTLEMEERENPEEHNNGISEDQSKWPLQPGLLIHINKMNNVSISQLGPRVTPYKITSVKRSLAFSKYKKNKSKVYARLERLKVYLGLKGNNTAVPKGIKTSPGGVVTFRKVRPEVSTERPIAVSRKRKKPGCAPNPSSTDDKAKLGSAPPFNYRADPMTDGEKQFYENLPFHGMQNPPNKPYRPDPCDLEYADVDYRSYGPINYKAASIYAAVKRNKNNNRFEEVDKDDLL